MRLTRIVIHGFKSFADKVELALEPGLTGVVGPNGCGKSNIVDALRWVSGEASARGVRGDDMDDVIFAGAGSRPARELADVMVAVEGDLSDYARHATDGHAEVRRTITRGHGSTFRIAGREVRARDVQRLFQDAGAGARGTAIVAQGQVQAVIEAKPEDRRRFLEEAAGVGGLQSRKREAESKLLQTEGNLTRIGDMVAALQGRVEQLSRQAVQAERYRKLAQELRDAEASLALARLLDARRYLAAATARASLVETVAEQAWNLHEAATAAVRAADQAAMAGRAHLARLAPRQAALAERAAARRGEADAARLAAADLAQRRDAALAERAAAEQRATLAAAERAALAEEDQAAAVLQADRQLSRPGLCAAAAVAAQQLAGAEAAALAARERRFEQEALFARIRDRQDALAALLARAENSAAETALRLARVELPEQDPQMEWLLARQQALGAELDAAERARPGLADQLSAADAALARLSAERDLLAQARPALERRAAEIAQQQERLARRTTALVERRQVLERERQDHQRSLNALGARPSQALAAASASLEEARHRLEADAADLLAARACLDHAEAERAARLSAATAASIRLAQQEGEYRELEAILPPVRADEVIAAIAVAEELAAPLAAALGEGLTASLDTRAPRHWRSHTAVATSSARELAELPRLTQQVQVPPALAAALASVWIVDPAHAARLQPFLPPGGALVSMDGGLWRWDGYVRLPGAPDAAALLLAQRDRQARLSARIEADRLIVAELEAERAAADQALAAARGQSAAAEQRVARARQAVEGAERAAASAQAEDEGWCRRRQALEEIGQRLASQQAALEQDQVEADGEAAGLPDPARGQSELQAARTRSSEVQAAIVRAQAARDERQRQVAAATAGMAQLRDELASCAGRLRDVEEAFRSKRTQLVAERAAAEADAARHAQDRTRYLAEIEGCATELARAAAALDEARGEATGAEKVLADARARAAQTERAQAEADAELRLLAERANDRAQRLERLEAEQARSAAAATGAGQLAADLAGRAERATADAVRLAGEATALVEAEAAEAQAVAAARAASDEAERVLVQRRDALAAAERAERAAALEAAEAGTIRQTARAALAALQDELTGRFADNPLPEPDPETATAPVAELEERVRRLRSGRDRLGAVNLLAAEEAAAARVELERLSSERNELEEAAARLVKAVRSLDAEARQRLQDQFVVVERHFEELFGRLFNGGTARLRLTDPVDPLRGGLELEASPPGKKLSSLSLMSGGEKALTALCLIFAFFLAHPSPLCVLDEVDAPLDDANVGRLVDLVQEIAARTATRFLVVTHHPLTMARMDRLYGVTMVERGVSRLVSVELGRALELRRSA